MRYRKRAAIYLILLGLMILLNACTFSGQQQTQQPDPRLKVFHILSSRIIILDTQAEVDGTIRNTGHNPFPFDVSIVATLYDDAGKSVGQAQGVAEDVFPGTERSFTLIGQVDSSRYSHMKLMLVSLRERRQEKSTPTPTAVVP